MLLGVPIPSLLARLLNIRSRTPLSALPDMIRRFASGLWSFFVPQLWSIVQVTVVGIVRAVKAATAVLLVLITSRMGLTGSVVGGGQGGYGGGGQY